VGNFFFFCLCVNLLAVLPRNFWALTIHFPSSKFTTCGTLY
jgi:hypothetical protein